MTQQLLQWLYGRNREAHRVGYLARNSEIKSTMTGTTPMELTIFDIQLSDYQTVMF